jgi:hypothetical protein
LETRSDNGSLQDTRVNDSWWVLVLDAAGAGAGSLNGLDDTHTLVALDFSEDNVLAIEPAGDNSGDEELRTVATRVSESRSEVHSSQNSRVWASVGHREKTWADMLAREVLVGKLLAVNGLSASALKPYVRIVHMMSLLFSRLTLPRVKSPP